MSEARSNSFGMAAQRYDRFRPGPPGRAVRWLLGTEPCSVALDLAAGTGAVTRVLAEYVDTVIAVEPDDRMRAVLTERSPGITALPGTGEQIPLSDRSVDAVLVSAAWHWLDQDRALPEVARVLRPGGVLGLLWNGVDTGAPWMRGYIGLRNSLRAGSEQVRRRRHEVTLPGWAPFEPPETTVFHWNYKTTREDLVALLGTYSLMLTADEERQKKIFGQAERYLHDLGHTAPGSVIQAPFRVQCWRARLRAD